MQTDFIDKALKTFALLISLITLISYSQLFLFFHLFDIDIYNYVDTSEILLSFTRGPLWTFAIISTLCAIAVRVMLTRYHKSRFSKIRKTLRFHKNNEEKLVQYKSFIKHDIQRSKKMARLLIIFIIAILITVSIILGIIKQKLAATVLAIIFTIIVMATVADLVLSRKFHLRHTAFLLIVFILYLTVGTYVEAKQIQKGKSIFVNLRLSNDECLQTDSTTIYIGSTRNYYFFRNIKTETNVIIPASEVSQIEQRKLKDIE